MARFKGLSSAKALAILAQHREFRINAAQFCSFAYSLLWQIYRWNHQR